MVWPAIIAAGATLASGAMQSKSARDAASAQSGASGAAIEEQRAARQSFERRTEPFRQIGLSAASPLLELLGIDPSIVRRTSLEQQLADIDAQISAPPEMRETRPGGARGFIESALGQHGTRGFAETIRQPLRVGRGGPTRFEAEEEEIPRDFEGLRARRAEIQAQIDAIPEQQQGSFLPQSEIERVNPLVSFLRDEGFEDIQESAAARGTLRSGGTLQDLTRFNTNIAATVVPQLQQQRFNQLFNILGLGQNAATGQGSAALSTSTNIGNLLQSQGAAQGQANLMQGQIAGNTISDLAGLLGRFGGTGSGGMTSGGTFNTGSQTDFATGAVSSPVMNQMGGF